MASPTMDRRQGLAGNTPFKAPMDCATTTNIVLTGEQVIDGFQTNHSRVLVIAQSNPVQNGYYDSSTAAWTRTLDADGNYDLANGTLAFVKNGAVNGGNVLRLNAVEPIQPGTTSMAFVPGLFSSLANAFFLQLGPDSVERSALDKAREWYSVKDCGAKGDGVTDDTSAINKALSYAATNNLHLYFPSGEYLVSALTTSYSSFTRAFHIDLGGSTIKSNGLSAAPLFSLLNARSVFISNGVLDLSHSLTQSLLVKIWANNGTSGATYNTLTGISFRNAQFGVQVGDVTRPNEPFLGENVIVGCNCIGVLNPAISIGVQSELNIVASQVTASIEGWVSYPPGYVVNALTAVGGNIRMIGGEITSYVNNGVSIQPIVSGSGNLYGKVSVVSSWIEVQNRFGVTENPSSIATTVGGLLSFTNCIGSVISDAQAAIDTSADFKGDIRVRQNYFWANNTRANPNINGSATTRIDVDSMSFTPYLGTVPPTAGFLQGIGSYTGGVVYYDSVARQTALLVQQSGAQSLASATWTKIQLQNETFDTANCFDTSTYRFQPTSLGYYQINAQLQVANTNTPCALDIYKNGVSTGYTVGGYLAGVLNGTASLSRVLFLNGTTDYIEIFGMQSSGAPVNTVTSITQLSISYARAA